MDLFELNNHFIPILFEKLSYENKTTVLLGDFNANLLNYGIDTDISNFLDWNQITFKSLLAQITSSTRITARFKTLIGNIFSNAYDSTFKSGNLLTTFSDHYAQFLFFLKLKLKRTKTQKTQYYQDFTAIEKQKNEINEQL